MRIRPSAAPGAVLEKITGQITYPPFPGAHARAGSATELNAVARDKEHRHRRIAKHAYLRAEFHGFTPGQELDNWLAAEAEEGATP